MKNIFQEERIIHFDIVDSTHKYLKSNYSNYSTGTIIIANNQINGIGTKGHMWHSSNDNILMSMLYKPTCKISDLEGLTIKVAEVITEEIKKLYGINLKIKKPNDLMLNNKKLAGILTEINTIGEKINYLIISIGFNVNETDFPGELQQIATSLKKELKIDFDKNEIIINIVNGLENNISILNVNKNYLVSY